MLALSTTKYFYAYAQLTSIGLKPRLQAVTACATKLGAENLLLGASGRNLNL